MVEISAFVAAPLGGATLAALGADVIRVDPPGGGIDIGRWPLHNGQSLFWAGLNQGKRSVTINTREEAGQAQVAKLITAPGDGGGIFLTNLPVAGWCSYERLAAMRPDLIMLVITGSRGGSTAVDYTVNAAVGFPWITGPEGHDGPINHVLPAWDSLTGFLAATAILAAERHRRLTGDGQLVELSLADVGLTIASHLGLLAEAALVPEPRPRVGNGIYGSFSRDFGTRDGRRVIVVALTPRQWRSLGQATHLTDEFAQLEKRLGLDFRREGDRWRARAEICRQLEPWIVARDLAEVRNAFDENAVLWGPYQTFKQLIAEDARASVANPLFAEVEHPVFGKLLGNTSPLRFGAADSVHPKPAPTLGQHTDEVLREFGL